MAAPESQNSKITLEIEVPIGTLAMEIRWETMYKIVGYIAALAVQ